MWPPTQQLGVARSSDTLRHINSSALGAPIHLQAPPRGETVLTHCLILKAGILITDLRT